MHHHICSRKEFWILKCERLNSHTAPGPKKGLKMRLDVLSLLCISMPPEMQFIFHFFRNFCLLQFCNTISNACWLPLRSSVGPRPVCHKKLQHICKHLATTFARFCNNFATPIAMHVGCRLEVVLGPPCLPQKTATHLQTFDQKIGQSFARVLQHQ